MKWKLLLQMFANSSTNTKQESTSTTEGTNGSTSTTNQHSSTTGGSTSTTTGHSDTQSHSTSQSHSKGGAESQSNGKSWASGEVDANTQAHRDKYNSDYSEGQKVADTYQRLQDTIDGKPTFQSQYEDRLNQLYESIMNQNKFSYDFNADNMYQLYKDQYTQSGKRAMQDSMGQAAALTGGYGSSYAQSVGQQTYQNYLQDLNNMIPELRNQAYQEYQADQQRLMNQYSLTNDAYNREYGQYRDSVSDWQADRSFNQSAYQDERNFDYNQFNNERNYWNQEYWNERNAEQSNMSNTLQNNWSDTYGTTDTVSSTDSTQNTNTSSWSNTDSTSTTDTTGWNNSTTHQSSSSTSNTVSDAGSGSGTKLSASGSGNIAGATRSMDFGAFDIRKNDYIANISPGQIKDMSNVLANANKNGTYQDVLKEMIKKYDLTNAEVGFLNDQAGISKPNGNYMNGFDNLGSVAPSNYQNYANETQVPEQNPGESNEDYVKRLLKLVQLAPGVSAQSTGRLK